MGRAATPGRTRSAIEDPAAQRPLEGEYALVTAGVKHEVAAGGV
jgi:hypothetical protein